MDVVLLIGSATDVDRCGQDKDVPEGAHGAYAYALVSDYYCYGRKEKVSHRIE